MAASCQVDLRQMIYAACLLEATARKPGNVHPHAAFADVEYGDFVRSAAVAAPILADAAQRGVGRTIHDAVLATRETVGTNTNLGIVLLLAPLAAVPEGVPLRDGISGVLDALTVEDAVLAYRGIRVARPAGMGRVAEHDLVQQPAVSLRDTMRAAAERDSVAAQYANGFQLILETGLPLLAATVDFQRHWETAVIRLHLELMSLVPDTLIARKCGVGIAQQSCRRAQRVLDAGWPGTADGRREFRQLDEWLRADGHRRNPGTTADLVTASLFAALREGSIATPPWERFHLNLEQRKPESAPMPLSLGDLSDAQ